MNLREYVETGRAALHIAILSLALALVALARVLT